MENLRELLNIYFSDDSEKAEDKAEKVYENTYESIFNTFNKEEMFITNIFKEILNEKNTDINAFGGSFEAVIEKAFEGAGKIGDTEASAYYSYSGDSLKAENYYSQAKAEAAKAAYINNLNNTVKDIENSFSNKNISSSEKVNNSSFYNETENRASDNIENIFDISQYAPKRDFYGASYNDFFDGSSESKSENTGLTENIFNYDNKNGGAEGSVGRAGFSAFVPSQDSFAEDFTNILNERAGSENINDVLNNYYGNTEGSRSITNNISPVFNLYGSEKSSEIDIDEIAEKIGEMLLEAAAGSADGFYG